MKPNGTAILNGDDPWVKKISSAWRGEKVYFGIMESCDIAAQNIQKLGLYGMSFELNYGGKREKAILPFFYHSMLSNFLAAVAVAFTFTVPVEQIIEQAAQIKLSTGRGTVFLLEEDKRLVDDSYNSNPTALEATLKSVAELPARRKIAVLGDMLELGEDSAEYHFCAGKQVVENGFDLLVTVGSLSKHMADGALEMGMPKDRIHTFGNSQEAAVNLRKFLERGDLILVKGSRGVRMEYIIEHLREEA
jgi:UDP-N-acetylmuramoyl-tripeptide--D-alanyl-D-alanine ligase